MSSQSPRSGSFAEAELAADDVCRPVTIIAGASHGIGLALARECAAHGKDVVLIARAEPGLAAAAADIRDGFGRLPWTLQLDVAAQGAGERLVHYLAESNLYADMLINNAAAWSDGDVLATPPGEAERIVHTNLAAVAELTRAVLPQMVARGRGRVLVVGSLAGEVPAPGNAIYSATKAFLKVWTLALRREVRAQGISVSLVLPGVVATDFTRAGGAADIRPTRSLLAATPASVAWCGYRGLMSGQALIVPGFINRMIYFGTRILPRALLVRLRMIGTEPAPATAAMAEQSS